MARADAARDRLERWLTAREDLAGVVLTSPAGVAWATGAVAPPVDRTAQSDLVWVVATPTGAALVTTEVEAGRVSEEYQPRRHGFADLVAVKLDGQAAGPPDGPWARAGAGWPLGEVRDPFSLEVHRPVQPGDALVGLPALPRLCAA